MRMGRFMYGLVLFVSACLAGALLCSAAEPPMSALAPTVVSLRPATTVSDLHVCLGNVASIQGADAALCKQLGKLDLVDLSAGEPRARFHERR